MKYSVAFLLLLFTSVLTAQEWRRVDDDDRQLERERWFYNQRVYPNRSIPAGARVNAIRQMEKIDVAARFQHLQAAAAGIAGAGIILDSTNWTLIGPKPTGGGTSSVTSGRTNAIAIDPRDNNVVYIGAAEGGVWKTVDGGANWMPLTDDQPSLANGSIAIDPDNPDTVYVGTGEENFSGDSYYGAGILKSTDAGKTWTNTVGPFLRDRIGTLVIQPGNGKVLLCAATSGIWRSADAGATWSLVLSGASGTSVVFDPTNGSSAFAALGSTSGGTRNGVYHSTDGGITWSAIGKSSPGGLPTANVGRIDMALAPSLPSTMYVQIQDSSAANFGYLLGIYKTTDGGNTWTALNIAKTVNPLIWGPQLWYDNTIRVSPANPDVVWSGALQIYRSVDGGATWAALPQAGSNGQAIHVDFHYLAFTADGSKLYIANDGGVWSTQDVAAPSVNFVELNDTLAITQFYPGVSMDPTNAQIAVGGTQDNNTESFLGSVNWQTVACGDGGFTAIDPAFPALAYTACQNISLYRTLDVAGVTTWATASYGIDRTDPTQFISPFVIDAVNPATLYFGTYRLWQSQDSGGRWRAVSPDLSGGNKAATMKTIAVAPSDRNTVYVGMSNTKIQVTRNMQNGGGSIWLDRSAGLPPRTITHIAVDPVDSGTAYATFSGFPVGTDTGGHVYQTTNFGVSWTDISGNLPVIPVNDLVVDPDLPRTLYAATDAGVMVTTDGGATWSSLGKGLPRVVVDSLVLQRRSRVLLAASHGRSVWDILVPLGGPTAEPQITSLTPSTAKAGDAGATIRITGANFTAQSTARWNGQDRQTTFQDSAHLSVQIPASDLAAVGRAAVAVFNPASGGGPSNPAGFLIGPAPVASTASIVSAANPFGGNNLALRSIATIYGANLAPSTASADLLPPLPFTLGDVTLSMLDGIQTVPLFYVSPTQINFQVPFITPTGPQTLVIRQGVQSVSVPVTLVSYAPALFTMNQQGTGQSAALISNTVSIPAVTGAFPNSRPVKIGEYVSIYCTGLGDVNFRPGLGSASPSNPLARTLATPVVKVGGVQVTPSFSGLAPGFVGLYQVDVQVPAGITTGEAVPVVLTIGGVTSNTVTIAVDPGQ